MSAPTICMLSCLHDLYDDRIYWKEALSLKKNGYNVVHVGVGTEDLDYISELGIRVISINRKVHFINPYLDKLFKTLTFYPNIYKKIFQKASGLKAEVYHFHDLQLNRIGPKLKNLPHSPKIIYDVHEPYPDIIRYLHKSKGIPLLIRKTFSRFIEKWQNKKAENYDLIITTEEYVADDFKKYNPNQVVEIIYNFCNLENIQEKDNHKKEFDAIYCGGISSFRGIWTILKAAIMAKTSQDDIKILLLGTFKEPYLKKHVEEYISSNQLEQYVILKDFVPFQEVVHYYKLSRCGIVIFEDLPVYRKIWPIKTFEYLNFGLPIISSNFGHTYDLINEHVCGIGIQSSSPGELLNAIKGYKTNLELFHEHSTNALKTSSQNYKWKTMEEKLVSLYNQLVYNKPS